MRPDPALLTALHVAIFSQRRRASTRSQSRCWSRYEADFFGTRIIRLPRFRGLQLSEDSKSVPLRPDQIDFPLGDNPPSGVPPPIGLDATEVV